jgi:hypothetical protein
MSAAVGIVTQIRGSNAVVSECCGRLKDCSKNQQSNAKRIDKAGHILSIVHTNQKTAHSLKESADFLFSSLGWLPHEPIELWAQE